MISFQQYLNNKNIDVVANDIVEHLTLQSLWFAPEDTLAIMASEQNQDLAFREAFEGQAGKWGNLWQGIKSGAKAALGTGIAGVGGSLGGAIGGAVGAAKGAFGLSGDTKSPMTVQGGARDGSVTGRGMMQSGGEGMKSAWQNRGNAAMVSAYQNSVKALDAYIQSVAKAAPNMSSELMKVKGQLEEISKKIEQALQQGQNPQDVMQFPAVPPPSAPPADPYGLNRTA